MSDRTRVCAADDLEPGDSKLADVAGREVAVFNVDGEFYALSNRCPHRGGPLCEGDVVPALVGEWPGTGERIERRVTGDPTVTCPWHGWEFDLDTGEHLGDDSIAVPTYEVVVEGETVYVAKT